MGVLVVVELVVDGGDAVQLAFDEADVLVDAAKFAVHLSGRDGSDRRRLVGHGLPPSVTAEGTLLMVSVMPGPLPPVVTDVMEGRAAAMPVRTRPRRRGCIWAGNVQTASPWPFTMRSMPTGAWGIAWTVGSFLLGSCVTLFAVFLNHVTTARREDAARRIARAQVLSDRHSEFEVSTLLDLHAALTARLASWDKESDLRFLRDDFMSVSSNAELERRISESEQQGKADEARISEVSSLVANGELRDQVEDLLRRFRGYFDVIPYSTANEMVSECADLSVRAESIRTSVARRLRVIRTRDGTQAE